MSGLYVVNVLYSFLRLRTVAMNVVGDEVCVEIRHDEKVSGDSNFRICEITLPVESDSRFDGGSSCKDVA